MAKKTVADINVKGKKILMRCDFNVPLDDDCNITSDDRIVKALPTIKAILEGGGALILMSHLGRPSGQRDDKLSLTPVARRLSELLGKEVVFADDCISDETKAKAVALSNGDCMLLENLRFHKAETIKDKAAKEDTQLRQAKDDFAKQLAGMADIYVDDAFGTAHRDNASMYTVPMVMEGKPRVIGFLIEKELKFLGDALSDPARPFVAILGGAKVSDKIGVIENLIGKVDRIIIGGAMAYTFLKGRGKSIGRSLCENDFVDKGQALLNQAKEAECEVLLPTDHHVVRKLKSDVPYRTAVGDIDPGYQAVDIGPIASKMYREKIADAKTIVWNGPMGVFETPPFDEGTKDIAMAVAEATDNGAISIVGGGDSAAAVKNLGLEDRISHISTGGGASLEFLEGKKFICLEILDEK
ncbi:MAG: phosphoglycerate kinase [Phycisphaerae bacterium SG8_4]|nr:MAG: phosphoglycerate kinase [Phycisphaerae bacterium SG8_4]